MYDTLKAFSKDAFNTSGFLAWIAHNKLRISTRLFEDPESFMHFDIKSSQTREISSSGNLYDPRSSFNRSDKNK